MGSVNVECDPAVVTRHAATLPGRFKSNVYENGGFKVPAIVCASRVAGLGAFTADSVAKGTLLWQFNKTVGLTFGTSLNDCVETVKRLGLTAEERSYVANHGYGFGRFNEFRLANDKVVCARSPHGTPRTSPLQDTIHIFGRPISLTVLTSNPMSELVEEKERLSQM